MKRSFPAGLFARIFLIFVFVFGALPPSGVKPVSAAPAAPIPISPLEGDVIYSTNASPRALPYFRWQPVDKAVSYRLQINTTIAFNTDVTMLYNVVTSINEFVPNEANLPDMNFYWRVRVEKDDKGNAGPWSTNSGGIDPIRFKKDWLSKALNVPNNPQLLLPNDLDAIPYNDPVGGVQQQPRPSFSWTPVPGATSYLLQLSLDQNFASIANSYETFSTSFQLPYKVPDNTYYWRVVPKQAGLISPTNKWTGRESDTRTVIFNYNTTYIPQPVQPDDGASLTFTPTIMWTPVRGANDYQLQYSTSSLFPSDSQTITINTSGTSFTPEKPLSNDKNYFWRVRAISGASNAPIWSPVWQFFMKWYLVPQLLTPVEGYKYTNEPLFSWTPVEGAVKYRLETSPNNTFSSPASRETYNTYWSSGSGTNCPPMATAGAKVFWRVIPIDIAGNNGQPSAPLDFDCDKLANAPVQVYPPYYYQLPNTVVLNPHEDPTVPLPSFLWKRLLMTDGSNAQFNAYRVQVDKAGYFLSPVWTYDTENMNAIPTSDTTLTPGLYFWRVRPLTALGGSELGQWSQPWQMKFDPTLQNGDATTSLQLLRPSHGSEWAETVPLFEWLPLQGASSYQIQISTATDLDNATYRLLDTVVDYPAYSHPNRLPLATYYWRVRGLDGGGNPMGGWSSVYRFQVAAQSRWRSLRTLGANTTPIIAADPAGDMSDPNYDLKTLAVTQDQYNWYFNFDANTGAADKRYMIYIDLDHKDNSGANVDPEGYLVTTLPGHMPEYAVSIWQMGGLFSPSTVWVYRWNQAMMSWGAPAQLSTLAGGDLLYNSTTGRLELTIRGPNIGESEDTSTMAVSIFSGMVVNNQAFGHAQDTIPSDPNVNFTTPNNSQTPTQLSRFISVTDRLAVIYPGNTNANDPATVWSVPPVSWNAPVDVPWCAYNLRVARDPLLTNWVYKSLTNIPISSYTFLSDMQGDNTYYWQVRPFYLIGAACTFGGGWGEASAFERHAPGAEGLVSQVENNMMKFTWARSEGASLYELMIDDNIDFSSPLFTNTNLGVNTNTPIDIKYLDGVKYYWRVRAKQAGDLGNIYDAWSQTQTFTLTRPVPTGTFTIPGTDPTHAMADNPTMCWTPVTSAYAYWLEISYDDQFKTLYRAMTTEQRCYTIDAGTLDGNFFWRVSMIDGQALKSSPSSPNSYTKQYGSPTPLSPLGAIHGIPVFSWTPVQGADKYRIEIIHPVTGLLITSYDTRATVYTPLVKLPLSNYKWRVAMMDNVNPPNIGPFSDEIMIRDTYYALYLPYTKK